MKLFTPPFTEEKRDLIRKPCKRFKGRIVQLSNIDGNKSNIIRMKILIAPNAFKGSLTATEVSEALKEGLMQSNIKASINLCPVGDGGDGTGALLRKHLNAETIFAQVRNPIGKIIDTSFGWIEKEKTAIIEMADAAGLRLLKPYEYNVLQANTYGLGQLLNSCLDRNPTQIILCIGGSATVDGGTGMMSALGVRFKNSFGKILQNLPNDLLDLATIDNSNLDKRIGNTKLIILCDVKTTLLAENGAAAMFGPQKGANKKQIEILENILNRLDIIVQSQTGITMSKIVSGGAAGGVAAILSAYFKAKLVDGTDYFLRFVKFEQELKNTNLVITGEGKLDRQTLEGKAPYEVAMKAKENEIPIIAVAGDLVKEDKAELQKLFNHIIAINKPEDALDVSIMKTRLNLLEAGKWIGNEIINGRLI